MEADIRNAKALVSITEQDYLHINKGQKENRSSFVHIFVKAAVKTIQ